MGESYPYLGGSSDSVFAQAVEILWLRLNEKSIVTEYDVVAGAGE